MSAEASASAAVEPVNVLLVDDRPDKLLALSGILADTGQNVVTARSGQEALRHLLRKDFAVILLDVNMPQMDGFETAAMIRERERSSKTPIIFLTAVSDADTYAFRGYSLGAVDYIHMPVSPEVLKAKVAVFADLFRKTEQIRQQSEWMRLVREREHAARLAEAADKLDVETRRNRFFTLAVDMLGIVGFDRYFRQLNPSWERTLGFTESELRERPFTDFIHPDDREGTSAAFGRLAEAAPSARFEGRHLHKDGSYRWLSWSAAAFGEERLVYVFVRDITFRKVAEEERLQLVREQEARLAAEKDNEIKDEFLATLSHELRAPLTPIVGWTALLRSGRLDPAGAARGLEVIERNAKRQAQLVEDLLDVSRIVSGKLYVDQRPMDLVPVIEGGLEMVRAAAASKHLELDVVLPEGPVPVHGDAVRLQQVVWNLVSNAVKFTRPGGRIEVRLEVDEAAARISVADTGIGISREFLPHVFDRFRQADTGSARNHGGLGLGLTIVHHLVETHGGSVRAESDGVGQGARFVVELPVPVADAAQGMAATVDAVAASGEEAPALLAGLKVLVVDDEPHVCEVLRVLLAQQGARVSVASSAARALLLLGRERPDVLVSDIGMPGDDGYALIKQVRARRAAEGGDVPAVALTAYASQDDAARALTAGFQVHLAKPIDPTRLLRAITSLTGRHA
jgi:PAS domain S-box-containing protein